MGLKRLLFAAVAAAGMWSAADAKEKRKEAPPSGPTELAQAPSERPGSVPVQSSTAPAPGSQPVTGPAAGQPAVSTGSAINQFGVQGVPQNSGVGQSGVPSSTTTFIPAISSGSAVNETGGVGVPQNQAPGGGVTTSTTSGTTTGGTTGGGVSTSTTPVQGGTPFGTFR
jgi:hypothetical protein